LVLGFILGAVLGLILRLILRLILGYILGLILSFILGLILRLILGVVLNGLLSLVLNGLLSLVLNGLLDLVLDVILSEIFSGLLGFILALVLSLALLIWASYVSFVLLARFSEIIVFSAFIFEFFNSVSSLVVSSVDEWAGLIWLVWTFPASVIARMVASIETIAGIYIHNFVNNFIKTVLDLSSHVLCEVLALVPEVASLVFQPIERLMSEVKVRLSSNISNDTPVWLDVRVISRLKITNFLGSSY